MRGKILARWRRRFLHPQRQVPARVPDRSAISRLECARLSSRAPGWRGARPGRRGARMKISLPDSYGLPCPWDLQRKEMRHLRANFFCARCRWTARGAHYVTTAVNTCVFRLLALPEARVTAPRQLSRVPPGAGRSAPDAGNSSSATSGRGCHGVAVRPARRHCADSNTELETRRGGGREEIFVNHVRGRSLL